jgi:hypothetical protein
MCLEREMCLEWVRQICWSLCLKCGVVQAELQADGRALNGAPMVWKLNKLQGGILSHFRDSLAAGQQG